MSLDTRALPDDHDGLEDREVASPLIIVWLVFLVVVLCVTMA